jgi:hypothetical protein
MYQLVKLEFYVPESQLEMVKDAVFKAGAGEIGNYDCCCWQTKGQGQFKACPGSNPFIGQIDELETVTEYKVELVCHKDSIEKVIAALKEAHPYETPAYQYWLVNT